MSVFPEDAELFSGLRCVAADDVPEPYRTLLVHEEHMTVTLETFHRRPVCLNVLDVRRRENDYARKLLLTAGEGGPIILAGIMRFRLEYADDAVRDAIVAARTPLGRLLVENNVLRRIQTHEFLRVDLSRGLGARFQASDDSRYTYGRLAVIFCDERPAVELLEVVAPEKEISAKSEA